MQERDDCEHRYSPFELDGVPMWRCLRCGHVCEDELREEEDGIEQQRAVGRRDSKSYC